MVQKLKKLLFVTALSMGASLNAEQVNVDVFPVLHPGQGMDEDPMLYEAVMRSQHQLMIFLNEQQGAPVFVESLDRVIDQETYFDPMLPEFEGRDLLRKSIQVNFLNGLPGLYEDFTPAQKMIVAEMDMSVGVLFQLGRVQAMLPTNTTEEYQNYVAKNSLDPNFSRLVGITNGFIKPESSDEIQAAVQFKNEVFALREQAALREISDYVKKNPKVTRVVLVFGREHEFTKYRESYPDLNIRKVNTKRYDRSLSNIFKPYYEEPMYDNIRFNESTQRFEMIPGVLSF